MNRRVPGQLAHGSAGATVPHRAADRRTDHVLTLVLVPAQSALFVLRRHLDQDVSPRLAGFRGDILTEETSELRDEFERLQLGPQFVFADCFGRSVAQAPPRQYGMTGSQSYSRSARALDKVVEATVVAG